jgi:hypothetical protein
MKTANFQITLIACLAAGLGFSLASSQAIGYPGSAAISYGTSPVWSMGGEFTGAETMIISAPADQDMIITDVFGASRGSRTVDFFIEQDDGTKAAAFRSATNNYYYQSPTVFHMESGVRIPAGETMNFRSTEGMLYTLSGYYAHP